MYYIGMTSDQNSAVTFEYGTLADAGIPAVLVLSETKVGVPDANFNTDGTITMFVPKSAVGNPQPGDLLGAIGGKTIIGDTPSTNTFERSTTFTERQKAALLFTSNLVWNPEGVDGALWERLRAQFSEEEIVEIGAFVALTYGQQRVIKTWDVGHAELPSEGRGGLKASVE